MYFIEEPNCQVVKLSALFYSGRLEESKKGLSQSVASMLKKSTRKKNNAILQEELDCYGLNVDIHASPLYIQADLYCHKKFLIQALPIFFELLFDAQFEEEVWKVVQNQTIESILQNQNQTDFWADKLLSEGVLGRHHPLGYYSEPSDYKSISTMDIREYYERNIQRQLPEIFIAGDVDKSIIQKIEKILSAYSLEKNQMDRVVQWEFTKSDYFQKKISHASQASIRLGKLISRKNFDQFFTLELVNHILGGYYSSLLMKSLRVDNGYTYGAYSSILHFPEFSFLQISYEADSAFVEPSLREINNLMERLRTTREIDMFEAQLQYYSQWSKIAEKSLHEINYPVRLYKLGYDYNT